VTYSYKAVIWSWLKSGVAVEHDIAFTWSGREKIADNKRRANVKLQMNRPIVNAALESSLVPEKVMVMV
jgi:hypothetical protein